MAFCRLKKAIVVVALLAIIALVRLARLETVTSYTRNLQPAPADKEPAAEAAYERVNAVLLTVCRNEDLWRLTQTIQQVEDRFNHRYHYDWVFFNEQPFTEEFKLVTRNLISGNTTYHLISRESWEYPEFIDQNRAAEARGRLDGVVPYGGSESYRFMCRYNSGPFFHEPGLAKYDYYWRIDNDLNFYCDIDYDVFRTMKDKQIKYGFTITLREFVESIPSLWTTMRDFMRDHAEYVAPNNLLSYLSQDNGESYNTCHFWSNFELADLNFFRSEAYTKYFEYLDQSGGFFYERWGDAPVHSIAASLFLDQKEVHYFDDVGYWHVPFSNCPTAEDVRIKNKCSCNPSDNFTWKGYSCTSKFYNARKLDRPKGWHEQQ